jgi:D-methionine transport system permease protein
VNFDLLSRALPTLLEATGDTLTMVGLAMLVTIVLGLPLGIVVATTGKGGVLQCRPLNWLLGFIINIGRSMPFIILMVALIPFTRFLVGGSLGVKGAVVPLSAAAIPFFARLVEIAVREVPNGLIEAARSLGGGSLSVCVKVLLPEALPAIVLGLTTTIVSLISYSAMAGTIGAGGLGDVALRYGYQQYKLEYMFSTLVIIVIIVQIIQMVGSWLANRLSHR